MARGEIYWLLLGPTGTKCLYLKNEPFTWCDIIGGTEYCGTATLWDQNANSTIPWNSASNIANLTKVIFLSDLNVLNCMAWFKNRSKLVEIGSYVDTADDPLDDHLMQIDNSASYKEMFYGCSLLENVLFRIGDGSNLTDLSYMFYGCVKLTECHAFWHCRSTVRDFSGDDEEDTAFDRRYVTTIAYIFYNCKKITESCMGFIMSSINKCINLLDASYALYGCSDLDYITGFINTFLRGAKLVANMSHIFQGCTGLDESSFLSYQLAIFSTDNVTDMSYMFSGCTGIKGLDLTSFNTSRVETMSYMFSGCTGLTGIDLGSFTINSLKNTSYMFNGCSNLLKIFTKSNADWNSSTLLTSSGSMFTGCTKLKGENNTGYNSNYVNKTYARFDTTEHVGYFSRSVRLVAYNIESGSGTVTGTGSFDFGSFPVVSVTPTSGYYTDDVYIEYESSFSHDDTDSAVRKSYTINLTADYVYPLVGDNGIFENPSSIDVNVNFAQRNTYTLSVGQEGTSFSIQGAGDYMYLDTPILVVDMNEGALSFLGWYENDTLVSSQNPYTFTMPNRAYSLTARFGEAPFTDEKVRQFVLTNSANETYKLTSKDSTIFLNKPTGLGYVKSLGTIRYGDSEDVERYQFEMPRPKGSLYFYATDLEKVYRDYNEFIRFSMRSPFILWYKIPIIEEDETVFTTYHLPVEITSIEKSEANEVGAIESGIEFYGTGFWKHTEIAPDDISKILNDGDLDVGFEITAQKSDSTQFTNPVITLSTGGTVYGKCALEGTFTKIYLNTKDKEQKISLWNGSETEISDPFTYIDFDSSDGNSTFPYPKLKNGKITSIEFSYDGMQPGTTNNVLVVYDKEYVSV